MPIYEYRCQDCGNRFEILQRLSQGARAGVRVHALREVLRGRS